MNDDSIINVETASLKDNGTSLLLMLMPSKELLAQQERIVSAVPRQVPITELHITLMRSPHTDKPLPAPSGLIELRREARLVTDGTKTSVYLPVTQTTQQKLARYVTAIEKTLNVPNLHNKDRIFHASLTNLSGPPGESVANVWEYPSKQV